MQAVRIADSSKGLVVIDDRAPQPQPGRGEVLIRVAAAGIIPTELSWYPTTHTKTGEPRTGAVPAHEFSGVVAAAGEEVGDLEVGHGVFGMNDWYSEGALAEFCVAPLFSVAPKPGNLTYAEAASVPISALTAWQGLFDHAKLRRGESVLIHGGSGGVGVFAIQLARLFGVHVTTTASAANHDYVRHFGAEHVIDYHHSRFEDVVKDMDVVFDAVGGDTLARSWRVLKPGGRMVTIVSPEADSMDPRVQQAFFIVEPNQRQLVEIAHLLDAGKLRVAVDSVIPFARTPEIYAGTIQRQGRGKLVVSVSEIYS